MLGDIRKSINSILYERTTSPFWGTILISWTVWNWRIVYLTLFVSEDKIVGTKIDYIVTNYTDTHNLITYPLISAVILLTIIPFLSNGAFWLSVQFEKWKIDQRNKIGKKQLLTVEQSIELREQILNQEIRFEKLLESKNDEISQLKKLIESTKETKSAEISSSESKPINTEFLDLSKKIKSNSNLLTNYNTLINYIQRSYRISGESGPSREIIALLESYDIIENTGGGLYIFTKTGKSFHKYMVE